MDEKKLKLYQLEVEIKYDEIRPLYHKTYLIYAFNEEMAKETTETFFPKYKKLMRAMSMEIKSVKEVEPKPYHLLLGRMD